MTHVYTKDEINLNVQTKYNWLVRAILALAARQTACELRAAVTLESNGKGFNRPDAPFMTSLAEQIQKGFTLSEKQQYAARYVLKKYAQQLCNIANSNKAAQTELFQ